jgi:hypothetical protein
MGGQVEEGGDEGLSGGEREGEQVWVHAGPGDQHGS